MTGFFPFFLLLLKQFMLNLKSDSSITNKK